MSEHVSPFNNLELLAPEERLAYFDTLSSDKLKTLEAKYAAIEEILRNSRQNIQEVLQTRLACKELEEKQNALRAKKLQLQADHARQLATLHEEETNLNDEYARLQLKRKRDDETIQLDEDSEQEEENFQNLPTFGPTMEGRCTYNQLSTTGRCTKSGAPGKKGQLLNLCEEHNEKHRIFQTKWTNKQRNKLFRVVENGIVPGCIQPGCTMNAREHQRHKGKYTLYCEPCRRQREATFWANQHQTNQADSN